MDGANNEDMLIEDAIERLEKHDTNFTVKECDKLASWLHDVQLCYRDLDKEYEQYVDSLLEYC